MKFSLVPLGLVMVLLGVSSTALAQEAPTSTPRDVALPPEPSTGTALLAVGGVSLGLGTLAFASTSICETKVQGPYFDADGIQQPGSRKPCLAAALGVGIGLSLAGLPLVIVGALRRSTWNHWRDQALPVIAPTTGGVTLTWKASF